MTPPKHPSAAKAVSDAAFASCKSHGYGEGESSDSKMWALPFVNGFRSGDGYGYGYGYGYGDG